MLVLSQQTLRKSPRIIYEIEHSLKSDSFQKCHFDSIIQKPYIRKHVTIFTQYATAMPLDVGLNAMRPQYSDNVQRNTV